MIESEYSIIKIKTTWNRNMSLLYAVIADTSMIKNIQILKLNCILEILARNWINDSSKYKLLQNNMLKY